MLNFIASSKSLQGIVYFLLSAPLAKSTTRVFGSFLEIVVPMKSRPSLLRRTYAPVSFMMSPKTKRRPMGLLKRIPVGVLSMFIILGVLIQLLSKR